jgi:hypothetical protein
MKIQLVAVKKIQRIDKSHTDSDILNILLKMELSMQNTIL